MIDKYDFYVGCFGLGLFIALATFLIVIRVDYDISKHLNGDRDTELLSSDVEVMEEFRFKELDINASAFPVISEKVLVDKETGVEYMVVVTWTEDDTAHANNISVTPLYNADGSLKLNKEYRGSNK